MAGQSEYQVLVVEDNPADAFRVKEALEGKGRGRFRPTFVGALKDAEARLPASDLVLLDLSLPDSSGADTVARVRKKAPGTPVVVLSGERDDAMAFRCLQHGAQDVLLKGAVDGEGLVRALTCALDRQALASERDDAVLRTRAAEEEMKGVIQSIPQGIVIADARGRTLFANPPAERLLGWSPGEGPGRSLDFPVEVGKVQDAGRVGPEGLPTVLEVGTVAIRWGGAPATLTSIREVAPQRRREGRRRDGEDTRTEEEFRESTRRIASGIARGLGEHFGVVLEGAFELSDGRDAAAYGPALNIQRAAWKATGLVRLLLASAGEARAVPRPVDLSEVVASAWDRVEEHRTESISLVRDLAPDIPPVMADRRLIEQALLTLVDHARNSVAEGGGTGTVTVRTFLDVPTSRGGGEPPREEGLRVVLSVSDSGPAFGPRACRRAFEPYYSTEVLGVGTGIGLAPARGIALQCGGTAEFQSFPGKGTTVRLLLPVLGDTEGGKVAGLEALEAEGGFDAPLPRGRETLLVAEGEPWLRWRIQATLQDLGYRVLPAATVGDAVRVATEFQGTLPLLISEMHATGMSGTVLAGVLRCQRPGMRALLLVDSAGRDGNGHRGGAGFRILGGPFRRKELAVAVRSLLDMPADGGTAPGSPTAGVVPESKGRDPLPCRSFPSRPDSAA